MKLYSPLLGVVPYQSFQLRVVLCQFASIYVFGASSGGWRCSLFIFPFLWLQWINSFLNCKELSFKSKVNFVWEATEVPRSSGTCSRPHITLGKAETQIQVFWFAGQRRLCHLGAITWQESEEVPEDTGDDRWTIPLCKQRQGQMLETRCYFPSTRACVPIGSLKVVVEWGTAVLSNGNHWPPMATEHLTGTSATEELNF